MRAGKLVQAGAVIASCAISGLGRLDLAFSRRALRALRGRGDGSLLSLINVIASG